MLGDLDLRRIGNELGRLQAPLELVFHPDAGGSALSQELEQTARQIERAAAPAVKVKTGDGSDLPARPALTLAHRGKRNIHYLAVPEGPQVLPFIEACVGLPRGAAGHTQAWARRLACVTRPAALYVFMVTTCPTCPDAVRAANILSLVSYQVATFVIDARRYNRLAGRYRVESVPTTVLDGGWSKVGAISPAELTDRILAREERDFSARLFASLVEMKRIGDAADLILGGATDGFVTCWEKSSASLRMGLLLMAERVLDRRADALDGLVPDLLLVLRREDAALRGDTADLLGQIGHPDAVAALEALLGDPNPDVAEIAAEALQEIPRSGSKP